MALHARYNKNGTKILCELKDISQLEINGYKYKENPTEAEDKNPYEELAVTETFTEKEVAKDTSQPKSKMTRRSTRKAQASNEKDIIL